MSNQRKEILQSHHSRRKFLMIVWAGLGFLGMAEFIGLFAAFLQPRKPRVKEGDFGSIIAAGAVGDFSLNSVTAFRKGHFYLSRLESGGFLALSRKCTHLGCTVPWDSEKKRFECPCHASIFDIKGNVINPPAPRALDYYPVTIENSIVKVDTGKRIQRRRFKDSQVTHS
jgi:cytochrome b6-f complex iron-sulfur subunit